MMLFDKKGRIKYREFVTLDGVLEKKYHKCKKINKDKKCIYDYY